VVPMSPFDVAGFRLGRIYHRARTLKPELPPCVERVIWMGKRVPIAPSDVRMTTDVWRRVRNVGAPWVAEHGSRVGLRPVADSPFQRHLGGPVS